MKEWTYEEWQHHLKQDEVAAFYLYTPLCGTCALASKMLTVVTELKPDLSIGKTDLNYIEALATEYEVESVPCLLIHRKGKPVEKLYAFQSVQNILNKLS